MLPEGLLLYLLLAVIPTTYAAIDNKRAPSFLENVLSSSADQRSCKPTGLIQDACCDFETIESVNRELHAQLEDLVLQEYFRYWRVDLFRECPFWQDSDAFCGNQACAVQELSEENIPEHWRTQALSELSKVNASAVDQGKPDNTCYFRESDFCQIEDNQVHPSDSAFFFDLVQNPERFTGYAGSSAHNVWKAIYEENCFGSPQPAFPDTRRDETPMGFGVPNNPLANSAWKNQLLSSLQGPKDSQEEEQCLEKRVYYRLISGLHASISIHICDEYLDQATGEWKPNLDCFISRIGEHPERLQNVYFDYVLLLRALDKSTGYLRSYDLSTGNAEEDKKTRKMVDGILDRVDQCEPTFDETGMFSGPGSKELKDEFKDHFRNVSRIMDCVGCDKCRLWGGLQVTGLGTALKLLFGTTDDFADLDLKPSEIVAFFNTLHRMSQSLAAIEKFRDLWSNRDSALNLDDNTNRNELPAVEAFSSPVESSSSTASEASIPSSSISETSSTKAAKQTIHFANPMLNGGRRPKIIYDQRPPPGFDEIPQRPEPHRLELPKQNKAANIFTSGRARRLGEGPKGNPAAGDWIVKVLNKAQIVWDKHVASRIGSLSAGKSEL